ncbi:pilus assembly FimT family protein [Leptolyngbya sp. AN03gr2]|uniref:pilus assembly FimT family protein n=1 Tax=unclassified Leptolyngbya TaxID=2650499 RepID=UPI003D31C1DB
MKRQNSFNSHAVASGFTLIEVLVTVVLIGILFAIAAPNWVAFINQQRVGSARNQVAQAIRTAQSEAQRTKSSRAIVFDNNNNQPRYAIVPAPDNPSSSTRIAIADIRNWERLGDGSIQPNTIRLSVDQGSDPNSPPLLIFDSYGSVVLRSLPNQLPYTITIGATSSSNPRRCVAVETILGATREGADKTASENDGCPLNRV